MKLLINVYKYSVSILNQSVEDLHTMLSTPVNKSKTGHRAEHFFTQLIQMGGGCWLTLFTISCESASVGIFQSFHLGQRLKKKDINIFFLFYERSKISVQNLYLKP